MAKKLSAKQVKARKQKRYTRYEYQMTIDALDYLNMMGADIKFKMVSNPTKASLKSIRNIYKKATKELRKKNWVIPTKREMAKEVRAEKSQGWRTSRSQEVVEAPPTFEPETDYIEELIEAISRIQGADRTTDTRTTTAKDEEKLQAAKERFFDKLAYVRTKVGDVDLAEKLAADDFITHIEELNVKYDYEVVDGIDDSFIPMLETAMYDVLNSY